MKKDKNMSFRIDSTMLKKLHYIARYDGRSTNGYMLYMIRRIIKNFEKEHGEIELEEDETGNE